MRRLNRNEVPNTRAAFVKKWEADRIFRNRAMNMGFDVLFNGVVVFPNGKVAGLTVK